MKARTLIYVAIASGLFAVSHSLEAQGDAAPYAAAGVSSERLQYHLTAFLMLLGALGFFIAAGFSIFRRAPPPQLR